MSKKSQQSVGRVFAFVIIAVVVVSLAKFWVPKLTKQNNNPTQTQTEGVPEMAMILSSDQGTRLKGARQLAERVGVEQALEIMEHSSLPHTGEGHLAVHQVGFYAYKTYGKDAILHCKDYFLYACYHGAIIEAASDQGVSVVKEMTDRCKSFGPRYFQCVHAAGHAINAMWDYDLPKALQTCDQLYEGERDSADILSSCHNGAFMENLFGVHDWGTGKDHTKEWLSDNPYFPCNAFGEKYQKGCWLNQAARIYQMNGSDLNKTADACDRVGNKKYTDWCFDNIYRQIHPLTEGNIAKVFGLCGVLDKTRINDCVMVNAMSYYSVGDRGRGIEVCNAMAPQLHAACLSPIISFLAGDELTFAQKSDLCQTVSEDEKSNCFQTIAKT